MEKKTKFKYNIIISFVVFFHLFFFNNIHIQAQQHPPSNQEEFQNNSDLTSYSYVLMQTSANLTKFQLNGLNYVLILVLALLSTMWYNSSKVYQTQIKTFQATHEREKKQKIIKERLLEQEFKSLSTIIKEQKEERKKIAQDLHDRIGCLLSLVRMNFHAIDKHINNIRVEDQNRYHQAYDLLEKACDEVRNIAQDMISGVLQKYGLFTALENLKIIIEASTPLKINLNYSGFEGNNLDTALEITSFSMIQELVTNIVKHANAKEIDIQIIKNQRNLNIMVEDDGKGFSLKISDLEKTDDSGLKNIYTTIQELDGELNIDSYINKGTTIIIDIPLA